MSTHASLVIQLTDDTIAITYVQFDGYLEGVGQILHDHYQTQELVEKLSALGTLSCVEASPDPHPDHSYAHPVDGLCVAYGRDRGEAGMEPSLHASLPLALTGDLEYYTYVWLKDDGWFIPHHQINFIELEPLGEALAKLKHEGERTVPTTWRMINLSETPSGR